jgi:hypothetical protein
MKINEWLAMVACTKKNFLENPHQYLSQPTSGPPIAWRHAIVRAPTESDAYTEGGVVWDCGCFVGQERDDSPICDYVVSLTGLNWHRYRRIAERGSPRTIAILSEPHAPRWLTLVGCLPASALIDPLGFLSKPQDRIEPHWATGVVRAANRDRATSAALDLWNLGLLAGQQPDDGLMNWYVAPLDGQPSEDDERTDARGSEGQHERSDRLEKAIDETGMADQTIENLQAVGKFEPSGRRDDGDLKRGGAPRSA